MAPVLLTKDVPKGKLWMSVLHDVAQVLPVPVSELGAMNLDKGCPLQSGTPICEPLRIGVA
eukprot:10519440-Alexandrium_andersonii.AAC.1